MAARTWRWWLWIGLVAMPSAALAEEPWTVETAEGTVRLETVARGLHYPWSLVFLPDGAMLVTEKLDGHLRRVSPEGESSPPLEGVPPVLGEGNGGLLGLALAPDFSRTRHLYYSYAEPGPGETAGLTVARATLEDDRLSDPRVIFRQEPKIADIRDFGGRLLFAPDGSLFILTGDRFAADGVQDLGTTLGKLVRVTPEGEAPPENPFHHTPEADARIWSTGHRNIGGAAFQPDSGRLWLVEFGPRGGDELNLIEPGANYGWPLVSWGRHYEGEDIPDPPTRPDLSPSMYHWNPVISPSSMIFHGGVGIPAWKDALLISGLSSQALVRLTLRDDRVISEERIDLGVRLRQVTESPEGALYLLTDEEEGRILRMEMAEAGE